VNTLSSFEMTTPARLTVLEPDVLAPQRVAVAAVDLDPDRGIANGDVDHRQIDLVLADRSVALAGEARVEQGELPRGRRLLGDDAVSTAHEMDVLDDVARLIDAGERRAEAELHVAEEGMLGHAEAHPRRRRIARADLDVDVAHRRIERARVRVAHHVVARHDGRHRHGHLPDIVLIAPGEDDHCRDARPGSRGYRRPAGSPVGSGRLRRCARPLARRACG
jgi:hypothetical protein